MAIEKFHDFRMIGNLWGGKCRQIGQDGRPAQEVSACQFSEDKRMNRNGFSLEQVNQIPVGPAEVIDPDGGIDEDYHAGLRRGTSRSFG